jgi:hypothetical protein
MFIVGCEWRVTEKVSSVNKFREHLIVDIILGGIWLRLHGLYRRYFVGIAPPAC